MRIIHTSDLHIDSALTSHLSETKSAERRRELIYNFERLVDFARELSVSVIIIAGDLFDTTRASRRAKDTVLAAVERAKDIAFLYLPGNHERDALLGEDLPQNLKVFGKSWTYFETDEVVFAGRSESGRGMFGNLEITPKKKNIVVLHGEPASASDEGGKIGTPETLGLGIDYLALGHYHSYSKSKVGETEIVFSGTPWGRGFDEVGEKGISLIEIKNGTLCDSFLPFPDRRLHDVKVDVSGIHTTSDVERETEKAISGIDSRDLVRVTLTGRCDALLTKNVDGLAKRYSRAFYYFEIRDESRTELNPDDFKHDKSLKGEFIRLVTADESLTDEEKEKIITTGLSVLDGDTGEEVLL